MTLTRNKWILVLVASIAALTGCNAILGDELNPKFCRAHLDDAECRQKFSLPCTKSSQCAAPAAVCQVETGTCVQCSPAEPESCTGSAPVCSAENTCSGCSKHTECASAACLPDGSCGDDSKVAYVAPAGTGTTCTQASPCKKVDDALKTARPYVKFGGVTDEAVTVDKGRQVTFLADAGAKLTRGTGGAILTVKDDGTSLGVYDLAISDAPNNASGYGVLVAAGSGAPTVRLVRVTLQNNPAGAISATGGTLTVTQSTISSNQGGGISATGGTLTVTQSTISGNTGGGISVTNAAFSVVGNVFFGNGSGSSTIGAVSISTMQNAANRLEFNSFNKNLTTDTVGPAIHCLAGTFTAKNNIMSGNGTLTQLTQYSGACTHAYSIATPGALPPGSGNSAADPGFVNTTTGDLHISATSPARGAADPASNLTGPAERDIDGQPRTSPADIGADEVP
jgi:Right handed beta helix region